MRPRPAIEDPEDCCARPSSSAALQVEPETDIALRSSSIKASNRRSATPISRPSLLLFYPPLPVPPPRPGRSGPRALFSCCATSPCPSFPVLEFDRRLKVDNGMRSSPWAHNLSWGSCRRQQRGFFSSHLSLEPRWVVACHHVSSLCRKGHAVTEMYRDMLILTSNAKWKTCDTSRFQRQKSFTFHNNT